MTAAIKQAIRKAIQNINTPAVKTGAIWFGVSAAIGAGAAAFDFNPNIYFISQRHIVGIALCLSATAFVELGAAAHARKTTSAGSGNQNTSVKYAAALGGLGVGLFATSMTLTLPKQDTTEPPPLAYGALEAPARPTRSGVKIARDGDKVIAKLPAGFGFKKPGLG
jgi:hypothetical protein